MMKLFTNQQIREWDHYTIKNEPITSVDLMERAATKIFEYFLKNIGVSSPYFIVCGPGNNGGDGLVLARKLCQIGAQVRCFIPEQSTKFSEDFIVNLNRLNELIVVESYNDFIKVELPSKCFVVDALFGSGLDRVIQSPYLEVVAKINSAEAITTFSIDVPSGLFGERVNTSKTIIKANYTITLQVPKLSFFLPESEQNLGEVVILDIGLSSEYKEQTSSQYHLVTENSCPKFDKRSDFSHKGTFGHTLLIGGNRGMSGAIQMSCASALKCGSGLVTVMSNEQTESYIQSNYPQAMSVAIDFDNPATSIGWNAFKSIGIGPGLAVTDGTKRLLEEILKSYKGTLILDADALNILAKDESLFFSLPKNTVLTPHPGEFKRLFGEYLTQEEAWEKQLYFSQHYHIYIVLKGRYTTMSTPDGQLYVNSSGNAVLAKGGSGDLLTGMIASLTAWQNDISKVLQQAVYLHGKIGEQISLYNGKVGGNAEDFIKNISCVFAEHEKK